MKATTLGSIISNLHQRPDHSIAIKFCQQNQWHSWSWADYQKEILKASASFLELDVKVGTKVGIISSTRKEWAVLDSAILSLQAITIPVYPNNTAEEMKFIINHAEVEILFIENRAHYRIWSQIQSECHSVRKVIGLDLDHNLDETIMTYTDFMKHGESVYKNHQAEIQKRQDTIELNQMATIIYTSGTTGTPKGAVLTHEQIMSEISEAFPSCGANSLDTSLTFLPFAHVLGRIEIWAHLHIGYTMAFAESLEKIRQNLLEIRPTFMIAVPRIFEKIYSAIWAQLEVNPIKRKLFKWALSIGLKISQKKLHKQNLPLDLVLEYELAKTLVLNKVKEAFGQQLRFAISGGAPVNSEVSRFFHACGILILEGYGLTETTAAICVNTPYNYRFGSVGRPIGEAQIKIAEDGEILVHSKKVMQGYYKDPEATQEVLKDGWFYTGDIGEILSSGDLRITDRKKDLIKTAGGKYVAPQKLEGLLKLNPLISHALIHGDQKKYIVALITLDKNHLLDLAEQQGWPFQVWTDLISRTELTDMIRKSIAETNSQLASFETIKKFTILPQEFTVEGGELTPSLKVKRKFLDKKLKSQIDALYR